jgi:hypothetical protein
VYNITDFTLLSAETTIDELLVECQEVLLKLVSSCQLSDVSGGVKQVKLARNDFIIGKSVSRRTMLSLH